MIFDKSNIEYVVVFQTKISIQINDGNSVYACDIYFDHDSDTLLNDKQMYLNKLIALYDLSFFDYFGSSPVYKVSTN